MISAPLPAITVLEGLERINASLDTASAECHTEVRTLQPGGARSELDLAQALERSQHFGVRGIHMRTLYQHTVRHSYGLHAYLDRLADVQLEVRTLEELVPRLMIFDRTVAYIPAGAGTRIALELRDPDLIAFLTAAFDCFWQHAVPLHEPLPEPAGPDGITAIRRSIARLLVEGNVDEEIAHRLGLNIRTCRAHIAKLSAALGGSSNRAQLGYQIARSGILDEPRPAGQAGSGGTEGGA
ncbi:helix-turn-helix transcriptional regulator [Streptomyces sp. NPDC091272]|uniref:helix-turn-helix transcriptional regulator n=1 Tax=Streptomyces sp. NPDC091272 TaxID=3365981 RepID=UPI003801024D